MSIWATTHWVDLPPRDEYGQTDTGHMGEYAWEIATSGCSTVIRVSIIEKRVGEAEALMTPAEARLFAAKLIETADAYDQREHMRSRGVAHLDDSSATNYSTEDL